MSIYFDLYKDPTSSAAIDGVAWIVGKPSGEIRGFPTLSQDCATFGELSKAIDRLQSDLETVRKKAKRFFRSRDNQKG